MPELKTFSLDSEEPDEIEPIRRLNRDLMVAASTLGKAEARYIVDGYYALQEYRKASRNQVRAAQSSEEPAAVLEWLASQAETIEGQIKRAMEVWAENQRVGRWLLDQQGIGPVLAAGLLAHLDVEAVRQASTVNEERAEATGSTDRPERAEIHASTEPAARIETVGHWWRFAGLDPSVSWNRGEKRPWNASLKLLCWKIGDSFVKVSNRVDAVYGEAYRERKLYEVTRNEQGGNKAAADEALQRPKLSADQRAHYERGVLPPGRVDLRARRWAVKLMLSHLHHVMYEDRFGEAPPKPYVINQLGHAHYLAPAGWPRD